MLTFIWWAWKLNSGYLPHQLCLSSHDWYQLLEKPDKATSVSRVYHRGWVKVSSFRFCFGAIGTQVLQWASLPEDTILPRASQLPAGVWMQNAANDREKSPKPLHFSLQWWPRTTLTWRLIAIEACEVFNQYQLLQLCYSKFPSIVPYLETLTISSFREVCSLRLFDISGMTCIALHR